MSLYKLALEMMKQTNKEVDHLLIERKKAIKELERIVTQQRVIKK